LAREYEGVVAGKSRGKLGGIEEALEEVARRDVEQFEELGQRELSLLHLENGIAD